MDESTNTLSLIFHSIDSAGIIAILLFLAKQHKMWVLIRDRVNMMYHQYCKDHNIPFQGINGY